MQQRTLKAAKYAATKKYAISWLANKSHIEKDIKNAPGRCRGITSHFLNIVGKRYKNGFTDAEWLQILNYMWEKHYPSKGGLK